MLLHIMWLIAGAGLVALLAYISASKAIQVAIILSIFLFYPILATVSFLRQVYSNVKGRTWRYPLPRPVRMFISN